MAVIPDTLVTVVSGGVLPLKKLSISHLDSEIFQNRNRVCAFDGNKENL